MNTYKKEIKKTENETIIFISKFNEKREKIASAFFSSKNYCFEKFDVKSASAEDILDFCNEAMKGRIINHAKRLLTTNGEMSVYYFSARNSSKNKKIGDFFSKEELKKKIKEHNKSSSFGTYNINIEGYIHNIKQDINFDAVLNSL